jgi:hypothetical protein
MASPFSDNALIDALRALAVAPIPVVAVAAPAPFIGPLTEGVARLWILVADPHDDLPRIVDGQDDNGAVIMVYTSKSMHWGFLSMIRSFPPCKETKYSFNS